LPGQRSAGVDVLRRGPADDRPSALGTSRGPGTSDAPGPRAAGAASRSARADRRSGELEIVDHPAHPIRGSGDRQCGHLVPARLHGASEACHAVAHLDVDVAEGAPIPEALFDRLGQLAVVLLYGLLLVLGDDLKIVHDVPDAPDLAHLELGLLLRL